MQYHPKQLFAARSSAAIFNCLFLITVFSLLCYSKANAQVTVKGLVTDRDGTPLVSVAVKEKGTRKGTSSDTEGKFSFTVTKIPTTLVLSAAGYESSEISVKDSSHFLTAALIMSTRALNEVVVTAAFGESRSDDGFAYSSTYSRRKEATASVSASPASPAVGIRGVASVSKETGTFKTFADGTTTKPASEKRTSLLTAGEVSDFKKWKMWEDYNETDFKTYSSKWSLNATKRYSIQLVNNDFKAVVGETVYLINSRTQKVIWTAVSDNTGKAELWDNFSNDNEEEDADDVHIRIEGEKKNFPAVAFANGINHIRLNRNCSVSNKVDIAFVVDATGSMGDEIEYLKEELGDILTKFSLKDPSLQLNTGAVFYRDKGDDYVTRIQPFTNNISNTTRFIGEQYAGGGGDYPEALHSALEDAINKLSWRNEARTKILFLLMDAPPHDEAKVEMETLISKAAQKGIRIVPVACSGTDKATEFIMRSMALATNGTYLFLTDDSGIGNAHIKPTTDEFKVELLNDLLLRIMEQMCFTNACNEKKDITEPNPVYNNSEKVKVFPNPTQGPVTLETDKELKEIFVTDFTGKILLRIEVKNKKQQYSINLSNFPSATYLIRYITKEGKIGAEKVVLVR